jgi:hypothetical protein
VSRSRSSERATFTHEVRVQLLEGDMDEHENEMGGLRRELAATRQVLTGILIALTTASLMLAINLVMNVLGGQS